MWKFRETHAILKFPELTAETSDTSGNAKAIAEIHLY